ncbi:hypothetical protein DBT_1847 [Dissulfuribacter thermophilus]|uniref:Uncharacterized protein n=1 Tax=Dissulfuribacter thermophilus TaxID=1156395 RepID=A0A1B9F4A7_9BACT|nr:hypothetical protein [Dissulfuribacter thermophilus]OCC14787.1 hypothetical protein DBT_1847 [Dissulfuribacter thermophilus]
MKSLPALFSQVIRIAPVPLNKGEYEFVSDLREFYSSMPDILKDCELDLLRNMSKKGIGFFVGSNFYPDFIMWIKKGQRQHVVFIDSKGLRQVHGFKDQRYAFQKKNKELEKRLGDPDVKLEAFIISNTSKRDVSWWSQGEKASRDFAHHHILFRKDDHSRYLLQFFEEVLA